MASITTDQARRLAQTLRAARELHRNGRLADAERLYQALVKEQRDHAGALNGLGLVRLQQGDFRAAVPLLRKVVAASPAFAEAHNNLGFALHQLGRLDEARAAFERAAALQPGDAGARNNIGNVLRQQGKPAEAAVHFQRALAIDPSLAEAHNNLGCVLALEGLRAEALAEFERAIRLNPDYAPPHHNIARELIELEQYEAAAARAERALALRPDYAEAAVSLANARMLQGRIAEAVTHLERALALKPELPEVPSSRLFCLNFRAEVAPEACLAEHQDWGRRQAAAAMPRARRLANAVAPERRLRVGYVSPDLREHSVAYFVAPLLHAHDRAQVEAVCYADVARPDAVTQRLRDTADRWIDIDGSGDDEVAARIRADGIDILVDLAGHSQHNRLAVFARRPAPVQMSWLGYPNTTGLAAIGYRITDAIADPPGRADRVHSETLIRLPRCFVCYRPPAAAGPVAPPPSRGAGPVTFGSFNGVPKLSAETIALWARVLGTVPGSRLLLKARALRDDATTERLLAAFAAAGIARERIAAVPFAATTAEHLELYRAVDIGLDPTPYNGTTTTCEALWMGVPVVALRGDRHAARVGASLLAAVGLGELVAEDADAYVAAAAALAGDEDRLAALRAGLRERMARSPLCDGDGFARAMEAAYRAAWQTWCASRQGGA